MHATSPPESIHALDVDALVDPRITFVSAREDDVLLGCGALKVLTDDHGEIKSMRTTYAARGRGVAGAVLGRLLAEARQRGLRRVSLETGTEDYFAAAHRSTSGTASSTASRSPTTCSTRTAASWTHRPGLMQSQATMDTRWAILGSNQ